MTDTDEARKNYMIKVNNKVRLLEWDDLSQKHPDIRCIKCPADLLLESEWETRHGDGYVLGDGSYFDPYDNKFFGLKTI